MINIWPQLNFFRPPSCFGLAMALVGVKFDETLFPRAVASSTQPVGEGKKISGGAKFLSSFTLF